MTKGTAASSPTVSRDRLTACMRSAEFWASEGALLAYSSRMQRIADRFSIAAAVLGAITSLSVWTVLTNSPSSIAQLLVSAVALSGAVVAAVPQIRRYGEGAGRGRELATQYGRLYGRLTDAREVFGRPESVEATRAIIEDFESVKARKDQLSPYPTREQEIRNRQKQKCADAWN